VNVEQLLKTCVERGASDIHLAVGRRPCLRVHGDVRDLDAPPLTAAATEALVREILPARLEKELMDVGTADFAHAYADVARFRVSALRQRGVLGMVLRRIPKKLLSFDEIGLPEYVKDLLLRPRGLVLVTGPTGSGKTTTLATMIDEINRTQPVHIVTIEDPIEYQHEHKKAVITQREVGSDVPTFGEAMRRVLRQDPDVVMLGEMRDLETISTAITAAETGHLVFGTLHTTGTARTIDRIIDAFPKEQQEQVRTQLALSIVSVISQVLVPRLDKTGVCAAFEIMINTSAIENYIRKGETYKITSDIQTGKKRGMILLDESLLNLYRDRKISAETALEYAQDPNELRARLA
jgi:twitching motility protein PilT